MSEVRNSGNTPLSTRLSEAIAAVDRTIIGACLAPRLITAETLRLKERGRMEPVFGTVAWAKRRGIL